MATFSTASGIANNTNGTASVPGGTITVDGTYYWRAKNVDSSAAASAYSATRSFVVDTTPPTMSSATVAADGVTVTVTWSENLDQTAEPGSRPAFSVAPNGGGGIAGTGNVSYPAANQTPFTLASSRPPPRHLALDLHEAGLATRWSATSPTPDRQPRRHRHARQRLDHQQHHERRAHDAGARLAQQRSARLNTATPTLTATFSDPDTNDTGKVTFQVCADIDCSTSLGTFDSTNTSIANGANGSASIPGGIDHTRRHLLLAREERRQLVRRLVLQRDATRSSSTRQRRR